MSGRQTTHFANERQETTAASPRQPVCAAGATGRRLTGWGAIRLYELPFLLVTWLCLADVGESSFFVAKNLLCMPCAYPAQALSLECRSGAVTQIQEITWTTPIRVMPDFLLSPKSGSVVTHCECAQPCTVRTGTLRIWRCEIGWR